MEGNMELFSSLEIMGHEQVVVCHDASVGLKAIIAIHSTAIGPSLGGVRVYDYASEADAFTDVLRLSRGMTYKSALAGIDLGGGKTVVLGGPAVKSEGLFRALGRHIASLGGRYIAAEDMNTTEQDMDWIRAETEHVTGCGLHHGGAGEPGPVTAYGVFQGVRATFDEVFGSTNLSGRRVAIQGVGAVGYRLAKYLHDEGAELVLTDINKRRVAEVARELGGSVAEGDAFWGADVDLIAPCAIGAVVNERTIGLMRAKAVAGAANNILAKEREDGERLRSRGILFAPDYVINSGGVIAMFCEWKGWGLDKAMADSRRIFDTTKRVFAAAAERGCTTIEASNTLAQRRIDAVGGLRSFHLG